MKEFCPLFHCTRAVRVDLGKLGRKEAAGRDEPKVVCAPRKLPGTSRPRAKLGSARLISCGLDRPPRATAGVGPDGKPVLSPMAAAAGLTAGNLYIVAFAVSWGPVMWVLLGEMFPNEI
jgi:hypothetical protein